MNKWLSRSPEEAFLLNPAFCCAALTASIAGYSSVAKHGVAYPIAYLVLPIVLHKSTREGLPRSHRTSLTVWLNNNAELRLLFAERAIAIKPYTQEALLFGLKHNWLAVDPSGIITSNLSITEIGHIVKRLQGEASTCVKKALFVGGWFANAGSVTTIMSLWGIRP